MNTITLLNEKGGVGKTTLATHLAMGLAARDKRVMLIDADPQGHSTIRSGVKKAPGLYDLLVRDANWNDVVKVVRPERYGFIGERLPRGVLYVVPSNVETRNIANSIADAEAFALRLDEISANVDYTIIDTSPTPSLLHGAIYTATDYVVYPTKLTFTSFDGLAESIIRRQAADKARQQRFGMPPIKIAGIAPMEYRKTTLEQQDHLDELRKRFGTLVWEPVPQAVIFNESESRAQPIWSVEPNHAAINIMNNYIDNIERLENVAYVK